MLPCSYPFVPMPVRLLPLYYTQRSRNYHQIMIETCKKSEDIGVVGRNIRSSTSRLPCTPGRDFLQFIHQELDFLAVCRQPVWNRPQRHFRNYACRQGRSCVRAIAVSCFCGVSYKILSQLQCRFGFRVQVYGSACRSPFSERCGESCRIATYLSTGYPHCRNSRWKASSEFTHGNAARVEVCGDMQLCASCGDAWAWSSRRKKRRLHPN